MFLDLLCTRQRPVTLVRPDYAYSPSVDKASPSRSSFGSHANLTNVQAVIRYEGKDRSRLVTKKMDVELADLKGMEAF